MTKEDCCCAAMKRLFIALACATKYKKGSKLTCGGFGRIYGNCTDLTDVGFALAMGDTLGCMLGSMLSRFAKFIFFLTCP